MKLRSWIARQKLNQAACSALLGISEGHLSEILAFEAARKHRRTRRPSPELAAQISAATGGLVTIGELLYPRGVPQGAALAPGGGMDAGVPDDEDRRDRGADDEDDLEAEASAEDVPGEKAAAAAPGGRP
jgi:hypothetical protein